MKNNKLVVVIVIILVVIGLTLWMSSLSKQYSVGNTEQVVLTLSASDKFSQEELQDASVVVKDKFAGFFNCTMHEIVYDNVNNNNNSDTNKMILDVSFTSGPTDWEGLSADTDYEWVWVLVRDDHEADWTVEDYGFLKDYESRQQ